MELARTHIVLNGRRVPTITTCLFQFVSSFLKFGNLDYEVGHARLLKCRNHLEQYSQPNSLAVVSV